MPKKAGLAQVCVVYVVDDDDAVRSGLAKLLKSAGLEARPHDSAQSFLQGIEKLDGSCLLLDITMPKMTGLQLQALLQERQVDLPVIAVSARDDDETRRVARQLGARMFLRKPVDAQALLDAISWVTGIPTPG